MSLIKIADVSKTKEPLRMQIKDEMKNEARILDYLNRSGYKYATRLHYCGYWWNKILFVVATEYIKGKNTLTLFVCYVFVLFDLVRL